MELKAEYKYSQNDFNKMKNTAILIISFGTSYPESMKKEIVAIEKAVASAFPDIEVRRAFTSGFIIEKIANEQDLFVDTVSEALEKAVSDGIKNLIIQPTHLLEGLEYKYKILDKLEPYREKFEQVYIGDTLMPSASDCTELVDALLKRLSKYCDDDTAVVLMGHGSDADANDMYIKLQQKFIDMGWDDFYIGTIEAKPDLSDVIEMMESNEEKYRKTVLYPLMVVAGDHASNDMAGDEEDSWKSILKECGYEVECILEGLGQLEDIRNIYVNHVRNGLNKIF